MRSFRKKVIFILELNILWKQRVGTELNKRELNGIFHWPVILLVRQIPLKCREPDSNSATTEK